MYKLVFNDFKFIYLLSISFILLRKLLYRHVKCILNVFKYFMIDS